jgi:hypothetical protein
MLRHCFISLLLCITLSFAGRAQSLSAEVLTSSAGGFGSGAGNSLSWTVGEPVVFTIPPQLTQGFHQPRVRCDNVDTTNLTATGSQTCEGTNAILTVSKAERGLNYQAYWQGVEIGKKNTGKAKDLILILPDTLLPLGKSVLNVQVTKLGCLPKTISDTALVTKVKSTGKMPPIQSTGSVICVPPSLYLFAKQGLPKYQWVLNDTLIAGADSSVNAPKVPGQYQVLGFLPLGCLAASDSFPLTASDFASPPRPPIAQSGGSTVCEPFAVTLSVSTPPPGTSSYQWRRNYVQIAGAIYQEYQVNLPGRYTVDIIDNQGCSNLSVVVELNQTSNVVTPRLTGSGNPFVLTSNVNRSDYQYRWYTSWDETKRYIVNAPNSASYTPYYAADYYVEVRYDTCKVMSAAYPVNESGMAPLMRAANLLPDGSVVVPVLSGSLLVFPNPVHSWLQVHYSDENQNTIFQLMDSKGVTVRNWNANRGVEANGVNVEDLPSGIYVLCVKSEVGLVYQKICIQK